MPKLTNKRVSNSSVVTVSLFKEDDRFAFLLEECENGKHFDHLSPEQYEEFWKIVRKFFSDNIGKTEESNCQIVRSCLCLIRKAIQSDATFAGSCIVFVANLKMINDKALELPDVGARNEVCKINEMWLADEELPKVNGMTVFTFRHLICLCLIEKPLAADLKRLGAFRKHITASLLESSSLGFRPLLNKLIQQPIFVGTEVGQKFIAYIASRSATLMQDVHRSVAYELSECKKKTAASYGKIYVYAWGESDEEMKPNVARCMQNLMEEFMKQRRSGLELPKRYSNLLLTVDTWNVEVRKKKNNPFTTVISDCYRPILWKYLQSGYNSQRCSAVDLFFKAFPLQTPNDPDANQELFEMQYNSIIAALKDDCHIVRIIAIREICNILPVYWSQFTPAQIKDIMTILTKMAAVDLSSHDVRRMVWRGLLSFLSLEPAFDYLKQILPSMKEHVHEINQRARIAFILLLIAIRDKKDPNFKFTAVVSMTTLLNRLASEKIAVGKYIVQLLLPSFYAPNMEVREWINRFVKLINAFPHSYRNFFMFSSKALPFENAHSIMCNLLSYMGGYVKIKQAETDEESENDSQRSNIVGRTARGVRKSTDSDSSSASSAAGQNCAFEDPAVVTGLFDIVTILWVLCDVHLNKPQHETQRRQLLDTYSKFAQPFISYYRDSKLFNSIITLSGNVPIGILTANSITLPGYCMKMLKSMEMSENDLDAACNQSMLIALIKWGRGSVVLEQVSLWLEAAFESRNPVAEEQAKRVKIHEIIQPNSVVAVYILDTVIKTEHMKTVILHKHYDQLFELWKFMGGIKELVYRRLLRGQPYTERLLSDEFLTKCFLRYVKLIPLLKPQKKPRKFNELEQVEEEEEAMEEDKKFDAAAELYALVSWAQDDIFPLLQAEECPEIELLATLINAVLNLADNMITLRMTRFTQVGEFVISLLSLEHNLYFLRAASRVATSINFFAKAMNDQNDELHVWSIILPSLLSHTLNALVSRPHSIEALEHFKQDFAVVKINIGKILATYEDNFNVYSKTKERVSQMSLIMQKMLQAVRVVLGREVPRADLSVPVYSTINQLHPAASLVLGTVYNKKFWTPLFLLSLKEQIGRSVKMLLIDILILHLFSKIEGNKYKASIESVWKAASNRLSHFKARRESGAVRGLGITLCEVENVPEDKEAEPMEGTEEFTYPTQATCGTKERFTGSCARSSQNTEDRFSSLPSSTQATVDRLTGTLASSQELPISQNIEDRFSGLPSSTLANVDRLTGTRGPSNSQSTGVFLPASQDTEDRLSGLPSSTQATVDHLTGPSGLPCSQDTEDRLTGPFSSALATMNTGSQPLSGAVPAPPRAVDIQQIPEDELIDDFINCGFELLNTVKELIQPAAATTA